MAIEFQALVEFDFDLTVTGFEMGKIDFLIESLEGDGEDDEADRILAVDQAVPPVSRLGDLWLLGRHRLLCGDATRVADFERLMGGERAQMVFTDPP